MAVPGGEKRVQGQGINVINPNGGKAVSVPYQTGGKNNPDLAKSLKVNKSGYQKVAVPSVKMGTSKIFKPQVSSGQG